MISPSVPLGTVAQIIADAFTEGGWVIASTTVIRDELRDAVVAHVNVSDMVPALRSHRIRVDAAAFRASHGLTLAHAVAPVVKLVSGEREVRRWSYCDA